jgi:hypothetical protein
MPKLFQKNKEDFICEKCGEKVIGDGYTNHCPKCLWSKHVDVNPGDRASDCGGMMRPIKVEVEKGEYILTHRCERPVRPGHPGGCNFERRKKVEKNDNFEEVIKLAKTLASK